MTIYRKGFMRRIPASPEWDPRLIGDIPSDWATKIYVLGVVPDPADPTKPMAMWIELTGGIGFGVGYGINYGNYYG